MKHLLLLALLVGVTFGARAQCNATLTTQAEVNAFGATGCTTVSVLSIRGGTPTSTDGIYDLTPLSNITTVTGSVVLILNDLTNIQGLDNIATIGGELDITTATSLTELSINAGPSSAFRGLVSVGSYVIISDNPSLTSISGFFRLRNSKTIQITRNNRLAGISGFNVLQTTAVLSITSCPALRSITGFNNVTTLVPDATFPATELVIAENRALENILGFTSFTATDQFSIYNNKSLRELAGFNNLRRVKSLNISNDSAMASISGFNGPLVIDGNLSINTHARLTTISGFAGVRATAAYINSNERLLTISGFDGSRIGSLDIGYNASLRTISGFNDAESTNYIQVTSNPKLGRVRGFGGLNMNAPRRITIGDSDSLTSLNEAFRYSSYSALTQLSIINNRRLATCTEPWICQYLASGGSASISNNAATCTAPAILTACRALGTDDAQPALAAGYPNPVSSIFHLPAPAPYQLYDVLGKLLLQGTGATISVADLPTGIYLLRTGPDRKQSIRLVKQ
ncbi:T9SS type A sorting domain-containing protein [Hymenobacter lucidus]|uniref:T9SS type A sorting domain-containing protein n=1 Tax=Hymenobacter lucidus TaxID=2880930 RepID=A0ABS8AL62_9BACT|nr:T9SS type A sorting domain-containing protein [Hymenobacter lucidus]MCB2406474.1 T9SS type A sorting domain-containing protein [Hymenobacter lucidus]